MILTEVRGIGVKPNHLIRTTYGFGGQSNRQDFDSSVIAKWLHSSAYLPAYGSANFGGGFGCGGEVAYCVFTFTGVDDNGYEITGTGKVELL